MTPLKFQMKFSLILAVSMTLLKLFWRVNDPAEIVLAG
jgi:hypothetical protein